MVLPVKDGVAVIEELRRDLPAVTIIAVSADTSLDRLGGSAEPGRPVLT
jgi:CheY-like chemotaxis protein